MQDPVLRDLAKHLAGVGQSAATDNALERYRITYIADLDMHDVLGRTEDTMKLTTQSANALLRGDVGHAKKLLIAAIKLAADDYAQLMLESADAWESENDEAWEFAA